MTLTDRIRKTIAEHALIAAGELVLVAVSGGADSLAMLHALHQLAPSRGFRLHAATVDHGLRGAAGAADADHVVSLAEGWGIPVSRGYADVPSLAHGWRTGIESAARRARYDFLAQTAHSLGASTIATAHHAGDQAETVLLHLLRGTGIHGLTGMTPLSSVPGHPELRLIRPLLDTPRSEIEAYCVSHRIAFRDDATNTDLTYTRNRIRLELLPLMRRFNPQIEAALVALAENARLDDALLESLTAEMRQSIVLSQSPTQIVLNADRFRALDAALQRRLLIWAAQSLGAETIRAAQVAQAQFVTIHDNRGAVSQFSDNVHLRVDYDVLIIERAGQAHVSDRFLLPGSGTVIPLDEGANIIDGWTLYVSRTEPDDRQIQPLRLAVPAGGRLWLRGRRPGDRFAPTGLGGHTQKLSDWMINRKVPQILRDRVPLVLIDDQIAAVLWGEPSQINEKFVVRQDSLDSVCIWSVKHKE